MTQFKEKAGKNRENASVGLYAYPNLMAADILAYKATHVPVGEDQKQHLELCRDIAQKFNNDYDTDFFPITEPLILGEATRVMSLRDGSKKMSKSDPSNLSRINLTDGPDDIAQKIRKARTDSEPLPSEAAGLEGRPEAENLVGIYAALSNLDRDSVLSDVGGIMFADFKARLIDKAIAVLGPMGLEMRLLLDDTDYIDSVLADGGTRARAITQPILDDLYDLIGLAR